MLCGSPNSVIDLGVALRAGGIQGQEGVAIGQAPLDDLLYRRYAVFLDVVLQHHGNIVLLNAVDDILENLIGIGCAAGIAAVDIPVEVLEALSLHFHHQLVSTTLGGGSGVIF